MADQSYCSDHCYVNVNVEGVTLRMMLDTGSTHSDIDLAQWESIGKPRLKATRLKIIDAANDSLPLQGVCTVKVKYCGQEVQLPLVVTSDRTGGGIIGTEWFEKIRFDFNSIFHQITFHQKPRPVTIL
jgi:predicted aspartyl protease